MMNYPDKIRWLLTTLTLLGLVASPVKSLERRPIESIPQGELIRETMKLQTKDNTLNAAWYLPLEALGGPSEPVIVIMIAKGQLVPPGRFQFASKAEAQQGLKISYTDPEGKVTVLEPTSKSGEISGFLERLKPSLAQTAGQLGEGMWFFTFKNVDASGQKIVSPYNQGKLIISFPTQSNQIIDSIIEFPLNSLYFPRLCPNGKPAHISWNYCPWDGSPLPKE